jgi:hypothetical protein
MPAAHERARAAGNFNFTVLSRERGADFHVRAEKA